MSFYSFGFEGVVDTLNYEKYLYSVIYLPAEIATQLPLALHPRLRVEGEINDYPFSGAFIPSSQGHHLILGSARLKAIGLKVGMPAELRFNIADQDGEHQGHPTPTGSIFAMQNQQWKNSRQNISRETPTSETPTRKTEVAI